MAHRYYTKEIHGDTAYITGADAVHLARVLRTKPGEQVVLCDGNNHDFIAQIQGVSPDEVKLAVLSEGPSAAEPSLWAEVYLGYSKGDRMETAIQKSVELGASFIQPFFSANCVVKPKNEEEKNKRYNRIAVEAAKQCGRGILPEVGLPLSFEHAVDAARREGQKALFLYECGGRALRGCVVSDESRVAVITGPEGGFTPEEAGMAARAGCVTIGLGPRILRSETAPVAALAALMTLTRNLE